MTHRLVAARYIHKCFCCPSICFWIVDTRFRSIITACEIRFKPIDAQILHSPVAIIRPVASRDRPSQNMSCYEAVPSQYSSNTMKDKSRLRIKVISKARQKCCFCRMACFSGRGALRQNNYELSHTSVFEMFRWETTPVATSYVAVRVFLPRLPENVLAPHDDHTRTFPEM